MSRRVLVALFLPGVIALCWFLLPLVVPATPKLQADEPPAATTDTEIAQLRKGGVDFMKAFEKGDASAIASGWAKDGEYVAADGTVTHGRAAIEKAYVGFFKENKGARIAIKIDKLRLVGRGLAFEEGTLHLTLKGATEPEATRYSAVHVREGDRWVLASVRETDLNPATLLSINDLQWLVGTWKSKREDRETTVTYSWDEDKVFLLMRYEVKDKDKVLARGTERIGKDASLGQLRGWLFDSTGGFAESFWNKDGNRWVVESVGTLPDGTETITTNLLVPTGKDSISSQLVRRSVNGINVPDLPPLAFTRVKK